MEYSIRNATPKDYGRVIEVIDQWFGRPVAHRIHEINFIYFENSSYIVDDRNGKLLAFLVGIWSQTDLDTSYIHFVGVRPDQRKLGIANALYENFFTNSLEKGRRVVRCMTSPQNIDSIKFHRRLGFDIVDSDELENDLPVTKNFCGSSTSKVLFHKILETSFDEMSGGEIEGSAIKLEPLKLRHREQLIEALADMPKSVWNHLPVALDSHKSIDEWITSHLQQHQAGLRDPYVIVSKPNEQIVGSTSFLSPDKKNRNIEIGWTWLRPSVWGSGVNTECKLLMLNHLFSQAKYVRVQFKTDHNNARSRAALEKIGAKYEGTLRKHMLMSTGKYRDSAFYSITIDDWPRVQSRLERLMERQKRSEYGK